MSFSISWSTNVSFLLYSFFVDFLDKEAQARNEPSFSLSSFDSHPILGPWPGNSSDHNPIENLWSILKRWMDHQKATNSDKFQAFIMKKWVAIRIWISVDWQHARLSCIGSMQRSWKRVNTAIIDTKCKLNVLANKSLWHSWIGYNYTSVYHRTIWQKGLKTMKQQTLRKPTLVLFLQLLATAIQRQNSMHT